MDDSTLVQLSEVAVKCEKCFEDGRVARSFVNRAQPRYIGKEYWASDRRVAFLMLNPGAGRADWRNEDWKRTLAEFRNGSKTLQQVFDAQRRHMPFWNSGKLIRFVSAHGLDVDSLALVNVAWCSTKKNKYPAWMLRNCMERFTGNWLRAIAPDIVVLSGTSVWPFAAQVKAMLPDALLLETYHYAHRPLDAAKAQDRAEEINKELRRISP